MMALVNWKSPQTVGKMFLPESRIFLRAIIQQPMAWWHITYTYVRQSVNMLLIDPKQVVGQ